MTAGYFIRLTNLIFPSKMIVKNYSIKWGKITDDIKFQKLYPNKNSRAVENKFAFFLRFQYVENTLDNKTQCELDNKTQCELGPLVPAPSRHVSGNHPSGHLNKREGGATEDRVLPLV